MNENQIWVLKSFHYSAFEGSMWYSSNGGNNWSQINTGLISDTLNQVTYTDIRINSSGIGIAIGYIIHPDDNTLEGFIQRTTDTGMTWSVNKIADERFKNVLSIDDNNWVVLGNLGYYNDSRVVQRFSSDMGISWSQSFPLQNLYEHTTFYNAIYNQQNDAIYMFATFGVYKSSDNGNSYTKMSSDYDLRINDIVFDSKPADPNNQIGMAWLKWNISPYLISFDGGHSWQQKSLPQSMGYMWLAGIAEGVIYIITDQTRLFKSTDYGDNWTQLNVPVYSGLQALKVYSKDIFVLNAYKNLVSSTDGGNSWITGPIIYNFGLRESEIISPGKIIGVGHYYDSLGTRGSFFKTSDFGLSWHITDTDEELHEVQMTNDRIGFALGDNKVYKTSNMGESWNIELSQSGYYRVYSSLAFTDSLSGVVIERYNFRKTNNGGNTWTTEPMWVPLSGIDKLEYNANGDLFAIGYGILLISPSLTSQQLVDKNELNELIDNYLLDQNYPNPFNPSTKIKYKISERRFVTIKVYDVLGDEIKTLVNEEKPAGVYEVEFVATGLPSGIYFYQLKAGQFLETKKMILLK
ncbi:MAG: T9SS type A sorting domain-containing protein [bacterium]|nr:T9SS type A sorting domain-containing protein [bacterium]